MNMRRLPPTAAPLSLADLGLGLVGCVKPATALVKIEREFSAALGVPFVFFFSSGRAGLTVLLQALHTMTGRRTVIVPAYTCFSVPAAVHKAGLVVQPCDINADTLDFDYRALDALVAQTQPLCVISTHLFGRKADSSRSRAICRSHGAFLVDDAAQALGVRTPAGYLGTLGDAGLFSFGRGKSVTAGSGGAVVTAVPEIAAAIARARAAECVKPSVVGALRTLIEAAAMTALIHPRVYWLPASLPFLRLGETQYSIDFPLELMSGAQAGLLQRWKSRLEKSNLARIAHTTAIAPGRLPAAQPWLRLPILCSSRQERDALYAAGRAAGLGFSLMYPSSIDGIPAVRASLGSASFPVAQDVSERLLTVPVHPLLSGHDCLAIQAMIASAASATVAA
jgi:dTDP-4-amino-4,6-dideoxygalactose transaminase